MNGLNFIRDTLRTNTIGNVTAWYNKEIEELNVQIYVCETIDYHYRGHFSHQQFDSKKSLAEIVNTIKLDYRSYLLEKFFQNI